MFCVCVFCNILKNLITGQGMWNTFKFFLFFLRSCQDISQILENGVWEPFGRGYKDKQYLIENNNNKNGKSLKPHSVIYWFWLFNRNLTASHAPKSKSIEFEIILLFSILSNFKIWRRFSILKSKIFGRPFMTEMFDLKCRNLIPTLFLSKEYCI